MPNDLIYDRWVDFDEKMLQSSNNGERAQLHYMTFMSGAAAVMSILRAAAATNPSSIRDTVTQLDAEYRSFVEALVDWTRNPTTDFPMRRPR